MPLNIDNSAESRLRRRVRKAGFSLHKSRMSLGPRNFGGWRIVDPETNCIVMGATFDVYDEDVQAWLED